MTQAMDFIAAADAVSELLESGASTAEEILVKLSEASNGKPLTHPNHARLIDPIKKRVKRLIARYFRRQKAALLADIPLRFHIGKEIREVSSDDTSGEKRAAELVPESLSPLRFFTTRREDDEYERLIKQAIERAEKQLAGELDQAQASIRKTKVSDYLASNSLSKLTGDFAETTKQRLRSAIADAVDAGGTADEIVAAIKDVMDDFSDVRAELVAQTEINSAYSWGRHELADAAGMTEKEWVVESISPCLLCLANMTEGWIDIADDFVSGDLYPVAHPGCQCGVNYKLVTAGEGR